MSSWTGERAPRSEEELREVLAARPPAWEYYAFAGHLLLGRSRAASRASEPGGTPVESVSTDREALDQLDHAIERLKATIPALEALFSPASQIAAFGAQGEPGDAGRIERLADAMTAEYEAILTWPARLSAVQRPERLDRVFRRAADLAARPTADYERFVDDYVRLADRIPDLLAGGTPVVEIVHLEVTIDEAALDAFSGALRDAFGPLVSVEGRLSIRR
jgi:hypothetical protein